MEKATNILERLFRKRRSWSIPELCAELMGRLVVDEITGGISLLLSDGKIGLGGEDEQGRLLLAARDGWPTHLGEDAQDLVEKLECENDELRKENDELRRQLESFRRSADSTKLLRIPSVVSVSSTEPDLCKRL